MQLNSKSVGQVNAWSENKFDALKLQHATMLSNSSEQKTPAKVLADFVGAEVSLLLQGRVVVRDNAELEEFKS